MQKVICEECYKGMQAVHAKRQAHQIAVNKEMASGAFRKYLIMAIWSGIWSLIGLFFLGAVQPKDGAVFMMCLMWAIGGFPVVLASGLLKFTLHDKIVTGTAIGTGNMGNGCAWILGHILGGFIVSAIGAPFIFIYSTYKAIEAKTAM